MRRPYLTSWCYRDGEKLGHHQPYLATHNNQPRACCIRCGAWLEGPQGGDDATSHTTTDVDHNGTDS